MAYTSINWQTGDTITADKLNRCDNGWGYENTQLFSETVTTQGSVMINAALAYSGTIDSSSITVTFNGIDYVCDRIDAFGGYYYGGFGESGPDFSEYPFLLQCLDDNMIYTETAGTYTVAVVADAIDVSDNFKSAVTLALQDIPSDSLEVVNGVTTWEEARNALLDRKRVFLVTDDGNTHQSQAIFASPSDYSVGFIEIIGVNTQTPTISWLRASSFDGVLTN